MFKRTCVMILDTDKNIDLIVKIAANNDLHALYKIGVYGKERQHEMFITGSARNFHKFKKELANINENEEGVN